MLLKALALTAGGGSRMILYISNVAVDCGLTSTLCACLEQQTRSSRLQLQA